MLAGSETGPREVGYLSGAVEASRRAADAAVKRPAAVPAGMPRAEARRAGAAVAREKDILTIHV